MACGVGGKHYAHRLLDTSIDFVYNQAQPIHKIEKVGTVELEVKSKAGHRERLKAHFIAGDDGAYTDEKLLELLLTYAIPQRDVQPLAKKLLATFGSLSAVLSCRCAVSPHRSCALLPQRLNVSLAWEYPAHRGNTSLV